MNDSGSKGMRRSDWAKEKGRRRNECGEIR